MTTPTTYLQWTYGGIALGSGTAYDVLGAEGFTATPEVRTSDSPRPGEHGSYAGRDLYGSRTCSLDLRLASATPTALAALVAALREVATLQEDALPLAFWLPGEEPRCVYAKPRSWSVPLTRQYVLGKPDGFIQWVAHDPRIYSLEVHAASVAVGSTVTLDNAGSFASPTAITLTGPLTHPRLELGTGEVVDLDITLASGETATIDSRVKRILDEGGLSLLRYRVAGSRWLEVPLGGTTLELTADSGSGHATVSWQDAWT